MKISSIRFYDYAAFYNGQDNQYLINTGNKNLLMYGENGSGKSSVFKGLRDFFRASDSEEQKDFLKHNRSSDSNAGYLQVTFDDGTIEEFREDGTVPTQAFIADTNKIKGFLSYKELLKTYLTDDDAIKASLNLFTLLVTNILKDHTFKEGGETLLERWADIQEQFETVKPFYAQVKAEGSEPESDFEDEEREAQISQVSNFDTLLKNFNDDLKNFLKQLNRILKDFLAYFQQHLEVEMHPEAVSVRQDRFENHIIRLKVELFGQEIANHHTFLNEARLSALALSIYLAAISTNPSGSEYKVLFLDDIFIGLDMSNRIPLLRILQEKFTDYQIFLTTYDKAWFEVMRDYFGGSRWKAIEMYVHETEVAGKPLEVPIILDPLESYAEKARKYFDIKDYPACGNYLRKALERQVKALLPPEYKTTQTDDFGTRDLTHLETLLNNLQQFFEECDEPLPTDVKEEIKLYKTLVLNPLSHDDPHSPIYKAELENAFTVVETLRNLPYITRTLLLPVHSKITYTNPVHEYTTEIELADNLYVVMQDTTGKHAARCRYWLRKWTFQGVEWSNMKATDHQPFSTDRIQRMCEEKRDLEEIYHGICHSLGIAENPNVYEEFQVGVRGSVQDLLDNAG